MSVAKYLISFPAHAMRALPEALVEVERDAHAVMAEARAAGVYVFAGGLDGSVPPVCVSADGTVTEGSYRSAASPRWRPCPNG